MSDKVKLADATARTLLQAYIQIRDARAVRKAAWTEEDELDKNRQSRIENEFLRRFLVDGTDNISASGLGTAYRTSRVSTTIQDWESFKDFVVAGQAWEFLEKRVNKTAVEEYKEEHGDLPPGVNWKESFTVNIRRK